METKHNIKTIRVRTLSLLALVLSLCLLATACGSSKKSDNATTEGASAGDLGALSGQIQVDGSSTVGPITEAIAEEFHAKAPNVAATVGISGTGGGFKRFCAGDTDISDASRPIKDEEKATCAANGVEYEELRVGLDGIAVVSNPQDTFASCLSFEQLRNMVKDTDFVTNWNQVDPSFPDEEIVSFTPGSDSGTFDFFNEEVLPESSGAKPRVSGGNLTVSEDDNVLVQGVEGQKGSWGYFGFAYYQENKDRINDLQVSGDDGTCVPLNNETVTSGEYPLSRPLFIYVNKASMAKAHVKEFVRFYLETTPEIIGDVGYVPAPDADYSTGLDVVASYDQ